MIIYIYCSTISVTVNISYCPDITEFILFIVLSFIQLFIRNLKHDCLSDLDQCL